MYSKYLALMLCGITVLHSSGCQNIQTSTKLIASVFNASTNVQKKLIDKYAPEEILVQKDIIYMQEPKLTLDVYQPKNVMQLESHPTVGGFQVLKNMHVVILNFWQIKAITSFQYNINLPLKRFIRISCYRLIKH